MTIEASVRQDDCGVPIRVGFSPFLISSLLITAFFIIYIVGIEPKPLVHNSFHDLRHGTGFPCH